VHGRLVGVGGATTAEDQLGEVAEEEAARALVAEGGLDEGLAAAARTVRGLPPVPPMATRS
jgi:hypothetical protein